MNCDLAGHLMDDYLSDQLSQRDRHFLEEHLSRCSRCAQELYRRPALERDVRKALTSLVRPLHMSQEVTKRIVQESQDSLRRAVRYNGLLLTVRATAGGLAALLLVVGLLFLLGRVVGPATSESSTLFPSINLPLLPRLLPVNSSTEDQVASPGASSSLESWTDGNLLIEPWPLRPGEPFTMTVFLDNDMPHALDGAHLNLDISGPSGYYHFVLAVREPLPAQGLSVLRVTPDILEAPCQEQYLISPAEVFDVPGVYGVRVTLTAPLPHRDNPR